VDETIPSSDVVVPQQRNREMRTIGLPVMLFVATCISTYSVGGFPFALALMTTLLAHEFGHFVQAMRYGVPASLPLFIPMPFSPIGTMGAVIVMQPGKGDRRAIFDIAITGPLAGLIFALIFTVLGLHLSILVPVNQPGLHFGEPLLFKALAYLTFGPISPGFEVGAHPIAMAGWVGIFITALNLIPIGQLDGGHILYALLRQKAHIVAQLLLAGAAVGVIVGGYWGWSLMILLLMLIGPIHPPTANDDVPLGTTRTVLGWLSLMFVFIGFTPTPFVG
jgi:membrane-associated protease RseP (regulator of RpoE activity)